MLGRKRRDRERGRRAALIARLHARDDAAWLAEILMDPEGEEGEIARLVLLDSLRRVVGGREGP